MVYIFCVSSRRRHTRCALVTGVQTCALPISYTGTGLYEGKGKVEDLRLIATLYPETIHIVARKDAGIESVADLRGKRVSLDEPGSGTIVDARIVLAAYGLTETDVSVANLKPGTTGDRLREGAIEAYSSVRVSPTGSAPHMDTSRRLPLSPTTAAAAHTP